MPYLMDGPSAGMSSFDPRTDTPGPDGSMSGQGMPVDPTEQEGAGEGEGQDEASLFESLLSTLNQLRGLSSVSEQNKLALEKAGTLIQQIKAAEEKEMEGAMQGKLTPGLLRRANAPQAGIAG